MDIPREIPKLEDRDMRDWFAALALIGILAQGKTISGHANAAYGLAEKMLEARKAGLYEKNDRPPAV
jgi:hypothetical protein